MKRREKKTYHRNRWTGQQMKMTVTRVLHCHHRWRAYHITRCFADEFMWKNPPNRLLSSTNNLYGEILGGALLESLHELYYRVFSFLSFSREEEKKMNERLQKKKKQDSFFALPNGKNKIHSHLISVENNLTNLPFLCLVFIARIRCFWILLKLFQFHFYIYIYFLPDLPSFGFYFFGNVSLEIVSFFRDKIKG